MVDLLALHVILLRDLQELLEGRVVSMVIELRRTVEIIKVLFRNLNLLAH